MKTLAILLSIFLALAVADAQLGGWHKIDPEHLQDPEVKDAAAFAVDQHNKEAKEKLKLEKVLSGESQVVRGINYKLVLSVSNGAGNADALSKYEAVVWVQPGAKPKQLTSFKKQKP